MGRLDAKHWAVLLAGTLAALATMLGTSDHWSDLLKPQAVGGLFAQIGILIGSLFVGAPQDPTLNASVNPGRRESDPAPKP